MPIEIKELVVRAIVADPGPSGSDAGGDARTDEIVQECVRQVLRILKRQRER